MSEFSINGRFCVQAHVIAKGKTLSFVKDATEDSNKLYLASDDPLVQQWIATVHHKKVKLGDIKYVVAAAKRAFASGDPIGSSKGGKKRVDLSQVVALNEACQKRYGRSPQWDLDIDTTIPGETWVDAKVYIINEYGDMETFFTGEGGSKAEAKAEAAKAAMNELFNWIKIK